MTHLRIELLWFGLIFRAFYILASSHGIGISSSLHLDGSHLISRFWHLHNDEYWTSSALTYAFYSWSNSTVNCNRDQSSMIEDDIWSQRHRIDGIRLMSAERQEINWINVESRPFSNVEAEGCPPCPSTCRHIQTIAQYKWRTLNQHFRGSNCIYFYVKLNINAKWHKCTP